MDIKSPEIVWEYQSVGVLDYDENSKLWLVQKVDLSGRVIDPFGNPVVNGGMLSNGQFLDLPTQYWVPRVQLYFLAEDPSVYGRRVADAYRDRARTEALIRYNLYLDCMPMDGLGELDQNSLKKMVEWARSTPSLKQAKQ